MNPSPSPNGRFAKGNPGGPGNPHGRAVAQLRSALFAAVSAEDFKAVIAALVEQARTGDVPSIRELLQRLLGPPESADFVERLEAIERQINELQQRGGSCAA